ncbi:caspase family protein [Acetivibrio cellulolyticus]|uniref:caspase family protein n=1 Tax=Acetivibrio cellulolyticus TaxID=35830 RepID=UPI0001E2D06E|nr:caspase family protein [Acetivibrio cellulolyticus]
MSELRLALIVGIDDYPGNNKLDGCINDAKAMNDILRFHGDENEGANFETILKTSDRDYINLPMLKKEIQELFKSQVNMALFYFSGHGIVDANGGYLVTMDQTEYNQGISMRDILDYINQSKIENKIVILDCCHAGNFGNPSLSEMNTCHIGEGTIIFSSCHHTETSKIEKDKSNSVFTRQLLDGLRGEAADILGHVTPGYLYALIDESMGAATGQRPIFKANVKRFISLRDCPPHIDLKTLKTTMGYFEAADSNYILDAEHEPTYANCIKEKTTRFANLQKCTRLRLVEPIDYDHMYDAAMNNGACRLTSLGKHYWKGIKEGRLRR